MIEQMDVVIRAEDEAAKRLREMINTTPDKVYMHIDNDLAGDTEAILNKCRRLESEIKELTEAKNSAQKALAQEAANSAAWQRKYQEATQENAQIRQSYKSTLENRIHEDDANYRQLQRRCNELADERNFEKNMHLAANKVVDALILALNYIQRPCEQPEWPRKEDKE